MSEALIPEVFPEVTTDLDVERRLAEVFGTMLIDTSMDDDFLKSSLEKEINKQHILHFRKDDQPTIMLLMVCRVVGILETPSAAIPIDMTKYDKKLSGDYEKFATDMLEEAGKKMQILDNSPRPMSEVSGDLYDAAMDNFGDTNLLRAISCVRNILKPDLKDDLSKRIVAAQRLAMALLVSHEKIKAIAAQE